MPQRFNGSWRAEYLDETQYTGHVRMEVRSNTFHLITGDIFLNGVYDGWWESSNVRLAANRLTLRYSILSTTGQRFGGSLDLTMQNANSISGRYNDDNNGGSGRVVLTRIDNAYRQMTAEIDAINGIPWLPTVNLGGRNWNLAGIYNNAGINLTVNQSQNNIPNPGTPLSRADLHNIMATNRVVGQGPPWWGYMLLATTTQSGALGVMFDTPPRPAPAREGCAVFVTQFNTSLPAAVRNSAILRTAAHEFGHALNLLHPSTANAGTTIMNQTRVLQNMPGWPNNISYTFRDINAEHLRHHPHPNVAFGGNAFGSAPHDIFFDEDVSINSSIDRRLELTLTPDQLVLSMCEPLYYNLSLRNISNNSVTIERYLSLDSGVIRLIVYTPFGETRVIHPSVVYDVATNQMELRSNYKYEEASYLLVDRQGPIFDYPGRYRIQAEYFGIIDNPWVMVRSNTVNIRVLHPTPKQELALIELESYAPRMYLELDGADHLEDDVAPIRELFEYDELRPLKNHFYYIDSKRLAIPFQDLIKDSQRACDYAKSSELLNKIEQDDTLNSKPCFNQLINNQIESLEKIKKT